jgi:carboxyl-terminal processing protease
MKKGLIALCILLAGMTLVASTTVGDRYFEIAKNLDIFAALYKEVNTYYVDEVNPNTLMKTGVDAMLNSLDPYTNYIPENEIEDYRKANTGQYGGVGALTTNIAGKTKVVMVYEGFVAHKNGVKIGDVITAVDGIDILGKDREETNLIMKGQSGSVVELTIKRLGQDRPLKISLEREKITISQVPYYDLIEDNIGYVKLNEFTPNVGKEIKNAVAEMIKDGAESIVLDLRGNPGGLLIEAVNICNIFLPKGKEVVYTMGKVKNNNIIYRTLNSPVDIDIPLTVLVNSGSASASEIVAGTLQDYDRAVIVGQRSFGKGLVQVPRPLSYNAQVKITTAKYYTPSGRCIQARDYSQRNADGSVGKVADSLMTAFQTTNGRTVYDGGGVQPEVLVEGNKFAEIVNNLYQRGLTLDFATKYYYAHEDNPPSENFTITDAVYNDFIEWMKNQPALPYTSELQQLVAEIEDKAESEEVE